MVGYCWLNNGRWKEFRNSQLVGSWIPRRNKEYRLVAALREACAGFGWQVEINANALLLTPLADDDGGTRDGGNPDANPNFSGPDWVPRM